MSFLTADIARKTFTMVGGGDVEVIRDLRFAIGDGEFVCIVGPSGCGKTTLLQLISGIDPIYDGAISIGGAAPGTGPRLGYMFQSDRLMPWMTVLENVRLICSPEAIKRGLPERLLTDFGLADFVNSYPNRLSGGMRRRVALARAYAVEPKLLLLDEPFVSLDAPVALRLRDLLMESTREHGTSVLFVTHDLREALYLADRIVFLAKRPARVALDFTVPLPRPRSIDSAALESLRTELLDAHPDLLAGLVPTDSAEIEEHR
ncbi:MAG: ABC transporter ATP-binding protein [Proteobacteria bacterium]|nr:ABC transporter ATP-binding protein [Pseudomonadota bacterium]MDA1059757.1 ABC transporter ATP-binding protein [Pseudomonadota bacterium]